MTRQFSGNRRRALGRFSAALWLATLLATAHPVLAAPEERSAEDSQASQSNSNYWDEYHTYLLGKIKDPTLWFDNFFGDQRLEEDDLPSSFVRFRAVARYTEGEGTTFPMRLRANINLPKVNRRLRLIIFGSNAEEERLRAADDTIAASLKSEEPAEQTNMGLRYLIYKSVRERFHFGGGLSLSSPINYSGRMRYERLLHVDEQNIIRFTETGFWDSLVGFGETSRLDLERVLAPQTTGRFSLFGTFNEDIPRLQWGGEINLFRQLSAQSALAFDLGVYGDGSDSGQITTYRAASRYRRNFLRPWLFFEIEPEVTFPLSESGKRKAVGALTTVLEIHFVT